MTDERDGQITMSRIPIRGGVGAFVLIVILIAAVLGDLPQLRGPFLGGVALGLLFAVALIIWRRRTMDEHKLPPGAHTMFVQEAVADARDRDRLSGDTRLDRKKVRERAERMVTRPGARPRLAPAS